MGILWAHTGAIGCMVLKYSLSYLTFVLNCDLIKNTPGRFQFEFHPI